MPVKKLSDDISELLVTPHIGIDEAGRGCLAGPVIAAAVLLPLYCDTEQLLPGLTDSKQLSEKKRDALAPRIKDVALSYGVGLAWAKEIDVCNIVSANYRAMTRAVLQLVKRAEKKGIECTVLPLLLVDGNLTIREEQWKATGANKVNDFYPTGLRGESKQKIEARGNLSFFSTYPKQEAIIKGDSRCPAIAAASILAKTTRDYIMKRMDILYPNYGFAQHKGYATKAHYQAIANLSPCPLHRMTFLKNLEAKEIQQLSLF